MAMLVGVIGAWSVNRAWEARNDNPNIAIQSWARWNYSGYERKPSWPEYSEIFQTMGTLPPDARREPSALGSSDPINYYGTSLALELLPYWTKGRIGSMEGLYFESSATTSFHFLTVSELAAHPSNPVRGLVYGSLADFDRGVKHLQMLGVRYYMAWTPEAEAKADTNPDLTPVASIADSDGLDPKGWKVYEVAGSALVQGLDYQPVVVQPHTGTTSSCFGQPPPNNGTRDPELGAWECTAAGWFKDADLLDTPWTASGPRIGEASTRPISPPRRGPGSTREGDEHHRGRRPRRVPRRQGGRARRREGIVLPELGGPRRRRSVPARGEPDGRDPARHDVALTYGLTPVDWLGRIVTLAGSDRLARASCCGRAHGCYGANVLAQSGRRPSTGTDDETAGDSGPDDSEPPPEPTRHHSGARNRPRRYHDSLPRSPLVGETGVTGTCRSTQSSRRMTFAGPIPTRSDRNRRVPRIGNVFAHVHGRVVHIVVGHDMRTSSPPSWSPPSSKG